MTRLQRILSMAGALLLLAGAPAAVLAQAKGGDKGGGGTGTGCARYAEPAKQAKCKANEARAARDAERKRVDAERKAERGCANPKDAKMRAECEKKGLVKPKS